MYANKLGLKIEALPYMFFQGLWLFFKFILKLHPLKYQPYMTICLKKWDPFVMTNIP